MSSEAAASTDRPFRAAPGPGDVVLRRFHLAAAFLVCAVFLVNWRFILVHFSTGGYLLDSGWFAYLFGSGDLGMRNPSSITDYSFYNMHISPWLVLFGLPFRALGVDGFSIFALHNGLMFALVPASLYALVARPAGSAPPMLLAATLAVGVFGQVLWRIDLYPHFEIATVALCTAGTALLAAGRDRLAAVPFVLALTVREDAGLFVALFLAGWSLLNASSPWRWREWLLTPLVAWAIAAAAVSAGLFGMKAVYFNAYPTFHNSFSGDGWSHLGWGWLGARLLAVAGDPKLDLTMLAVLALAFRSWRYLVFPVLVLPLIVAQLLAVHKAVGQFQIYYAIPWLVVWLGLIVAAAVRAGRGELGKREAATVLGFALACTVLVPGFDLRLPGLGPVGLIATRGTVDLPALARDIEAAMGPDRADVCLSIGTVALVPDSIAPREHVRAPDDIGRCGRLFLFVGDMDYASLRKQAAGLGMRRQALIGDRVEIYARSP